MKALFKPSLLVLGSLLAMPHIFAQDDKVVEEKKSQSVTIRKKTDAKEKVTVVIDGDKITVNGKPIEEFKDSDIEISRNDEDFDMDLGSLGSMGRARMLGDNFVREIRSNKAFLGVMTKKVDAGAQVTEITKESAAEKAGLKEGDIIRKIDESKIEDADGLYQVISKYKPEDKIAITYLRAGKENKATATLGENKQVKVYSFNNGGNNDFNFDYTLPPAAPDAPFAKGFKGPRGFSWNSSDKPRLGIQVQETEDGKGVKVLELDDDAAAAKAGLEEEDIITAINGSNVTSLENIKTVMRNVKPGDTIKLDIIRDGKTQTLNIKFPKELKTIDL